MCLVAIEFLIETTENPIVTMIISTISNYRNWHFFGFCFGSNLAQICHIREWKICRKNVYISFAGSGLEL